MIRVPPCDLKFVRERAAAGAGTSDRRHQAHGCPVCVQVIFLLGRTLKLLASPGVIAAIIIE
jgi:hypothetical protein